MMKTSELRGFTKEELNAKLLELRKEMFTLRLKQSTGSLDKLHVIRQTRILVARIKTILSQKEREVSNG